MEKNETIVAVADGLGTNGEGIVRHEGVTLFVPYLISGEKAQIKILKRKGNVAYGKAEEVLTPAEERVRPVCPVFGKCGGCQLQHLRYRSQLKFKTRLVKDTLRRIGGIEVPVNECERSEKEYAYRNKLQLPIGRSGGENVIGFYAERSHRIVPASSCALHPEWAEKLISALHTFMQTCGLDGYDEQTGEGQLRHIVVRELRGRFLVTLVATVREIKGIDYLLYLLDQIFGEYSFFLNINREKTNVIFGKEHILLKGKESFECIDCGVTFEAGAQTFVQVNENVRTKLYEKALSFVEEGETAIDCYAGGGLLTAMLAKKCGKAYGIEIVPEACECADAVRDKNGLEGNMTNLCGRVEDLIGGVLQKAPSATVLLDPPRAGVARSVLNTIMAQRIERLIMISCDPATLARDLGILTGTLVETAGGELMKSDGADGVYKIEFVQPFDMFPQTKHVETLVMLQRK